MTGSVLAALKEAMNAISSGLMVPTIAILLIFAAFMIIELGGLVVETATERRRTRVNVAALLDSFQGKTVGEISTEIDNSRLSGRQKAALGELLKHAALPCAAHQSLARRLLAGEELYYARITSRTDLVARLGPMLGLMATLIPLGPGLMAMGQGDTALLANSLLTAFDATVTGLAAAGAAYFISQLRKRWYEDYLSCLETLMECLLEVLADDRGIKN